MFDIKKAEPLVPSQPATKESASDSRESAFNRYIEDTVLSALYEGKTIGVVLSNNSLELESHSALPRDFIADVRRHFTHPSVLIHPSQIVDSYGVSGYLTLIALIEQLHASGYVVTKNSAHRIRKRALENFEESVSFLYITRPLVVEEQ